MIFNRIFVNGADSQVYDSPERHPYIGDEEREYIRQRLPDAGKADAIKKKFAAQISSSNEGEIIPGINDPDLLKSVNKREDNIRAKEEKFEDLKTVVFTPNFTDNLEKVNNEQHAFDLSDRNTTLCFLHERKFLIHLRRYFTLKIVTEYNPLNKNS